MQDERGVQISHGPLMSKYIKEELEQLIFEDKLSYEEIGRRYGCTGANIKKQAKKLGIELPKRRTINNNEHFNKNKNARYCLVCGKQLPSENKKYCSYKCQQEHAYITYIERWKNGEETGIKGNDQLSNYLRRYIFEKYDSKCCKCGWHKTNPYSGLIPLQVHHKDGNCLNNNEDNLELLCPNCHALTENYGNLNESSQRIR